jgi:hypothetical protein
MGGGKGIGRGDVGRGSLVRSARRWALTEISMNSLDVRRLGLALLVAPALALAGCRCCRPCATPCFTTVAAPMPNPVASAPAAATAASQPTKVLLQIQVFEVTAQAAARLHVGEPTQGETYGVMSVKQGEELAAMLWNEEGVRLLNLPAIVTAFGDEASLFIGETVGPDVPGRTGTPPLTFPVGDAAGDNWTGLRTATTVAPPAADGTLSLDLKMARRDAPAKGTAPDLAALRASEVTIRAQKMRLRPGETAVLAGPEGLSSKSEKLLVLVRPTALTETAAR